MMATTPTVSVVMAAKNYARFLPTAVESVVAQTLPDWELVIVDDGSTDDTALVVRSCFADHRIRYVPSDRLGQSRAKNLGVGLTRGEYVAFLDADDAWQPAKLERQLLALKENPDAGVCFTRRILIDEAGDPLPQQPRRDPMPSGRVLNELFLRNFVCFSSVMVRRQVFDHVGGFDPEWDLSIDYDLWLRAARHHGFVAVDDDLVRYRTGHGNLSKKLADRVATAASIMTRAVFRRGLGAELPPDTVAEGFASTYRALAYTLRPSEPRTAAGWYLRALMWSSQRSASIKGLVASAGAWVRGKCDVGAAENATVNR